MNSSHVYHHKTNIHLLSAKACYPESRHFMTFLTFLIFKFKNTYSSSKFSELHEKLLRLQEQHTPHLWDYSNVIFFILKLKFQIIYLNFCLFLLKSSHSLISRLVSLLSMKRIKRYFPRRRSEDMWTNFRPADVSETPTEEQTGSTIFMGMLFPML